MRAQSQRWCQGGFTILLIMLIVFLAVSTWMLAKNSASGARNQLDKTTATALALAKDALIGRAAIDDDRPGSLPCPDTNDDGVAQLFAGNQCPSYIGRLPWKTLRVGDLRDGSGERLWYALAPALRNDDSAQPINSQKPLELTFDGVPNIAAIVFSPGPPLAKQTGRPGNALADYLDGSNNDGDYAYVSGPASPSFNDQVLAITREDIFRTVSQRVLAEVRGPAGVPGYGLRRYHADNATFPWADSGSDGYGDIGTTVGNFPDKDLVMNPATLAWLNANAWLPLVAYQKLGADLVRIAIGSSKMDVIPCPSTPCP